MTVGIQNFTKYGAFYEANHAKVTHLMEGISVIVVIHTVVGWSSC